MISKKNISYSIKKKRKINKGGMKERIVSFKRGHNFKKYTVFVKNIKTKKIRKLHFGDKRYQQFKDSTPLKLYKHKNHNTLKRRRNYYSRHSGTKKKGLAIKKEKKNSKGFYTPKILSHIYLW